MLLQASIFIQEQHSTAMAGISVIFLQESVWSYVCLSHLSLRYCGMCWYSKILKEMPAF